MNSNEDNIRLARNTVFLFVRSIFLLFISLFTSRVTLNVLGVVDYGVYNVVGGVVAMFSMFSHTLAAASQRFITYALGEKNETALKNVFSTSLSLHIVLGVIIVIILEIVGIWFLNNKLNIPFQRLDAARWVFHISIATLFVGIVSVPYNAVVVAHERMSAFAYISLLEGVLKLCVAFLLMFITWDKLVVYAILMFVLALLNRSIYSVYSHRNFSETQNVRLRIDVRLFKEMFAFAGWNLIGNGSLVLRNQGVDIVLNLFFGVIANAGKAISNQVQHAVEHLVGNFTTAIRPQLTKAIAAKNIERTNTLINNGTRFSFCFMLFFTSPIVIFAPELLNLWLVDVPQYAVAFVRWTMFYLLMRPLTVLLIHSILSYGKIRNYQVTIGVMKLSAVPMVYILYRLGFSPIASVFANILIEIICLITTLLFMYRMFDFNVKFFISSCLSRCIVTTCVVFAVSLSLLAVLHLGLFVSIPLIVAVTAMTIWLLGLKKNEQCELIILLKNRLHHH